LFIVIPGTFSTKEKEYSELRLYLQNNELSKVNNEEATAALLNYFAELGASDETVKVDYIFCEQLLLSAGM